ncbi:MAG TPA: LD-carboxypeptidase [Candidatus Acidoferrum sp.]|nr:LD-carboxypeptidase [Candidatus Acidoferrum sp.]
MSSTRPLARSLSSLGKPKALQQGDTLAVFAPASPAEKKSCAAGLAELRRMKFGISATDNRLLSSEGYFAASLEERRQEFLDALAAEKVAGLVALRGGYGSTYLLEEALAQKVREPKVLIGFSDLTSLQIFLWQRASWVTFYGPMVAAGFAAGAGKPGGYDEQSFQSAVSNGEPDCTISLRGEALVHGTAEGRLLGGAMTLVEATFGTPWELDTRGAILLLEDRAMKPYQVDRVLMHFLQAGKLEHVQGIVLGDFPECAPPVIGSPTVREVCARILGPLGVPVVFGAPVGHTARPMLTIPLGVKARLVAQGDGSLELLEAAVTR